MVLNEEETNRELCFGALRTKVLAHREPEIPPSIVVVFENHWPRIPCIISRRQGSKDTIIRVSVENSTSSIGMISHESAAAIAALYDGLAGGTIRFQCAILPQPRKTESSTGHIIFEFEAVIYGKPSLFQNVGNLLSSKNLYLQQPLEYDKTTRYQNPHYYIKHQRLKTGVFQQPRFQDVSKTPEEIQRDIDSVFDKLMATEAKLPEKEAPEAIVTPLYIPFRLELMKDINIRNKLYFGLRRWKRNLHMRIGRIIRHFGGQGKKAVAWYITILSQIRKQRPSQWNQEVESLLMMYVLDNRD